MPRYPRGKENKGLPARWQHYHGAYYYRVPPGFEHLWDGKKRFRLGSSLPEAYDKWAERISHNDSASTVDALLEAYALKIVPTKSPKTQPDNLRAIVNLRKRFGHFTIRGQQVVKPRHVYEYFSKRGGNTAARREVEVLSHAFSTAVTWGWIDDHPFMGLVRLKKADPRTRYVEDWEIIEALSLKPFRKKGSVLMIQSYIRLKLLTGMARGDLLRLRFGQHIREDGIHIIRHKTKKKVSTPTIYDYEKVPERREAVENAKLARPIAFSPFLFCTKSGEGYVNEKKGTANGFDSMWQRFMNRVLKETKVSERFTEHDLRAKVGSDAESLEKARALLSHADTRTTQRFYRRKPERV